MALVHYHRPLVMHSPEAGELGEHARPILMNRIGELCVLRYRALIPSTAAHVKRALGVRICALLLGVHERGAALCALPVNGDMAFAQEMVLGIGGGPRCHYDPMSP